MLCCAVLKGRREDGDTYRKEIVGTEGGGEGVEMHGRSLKGDVGCWRALWWRICPPALGVLLALRSRCWPGPVMMFSR